MDLYGASPKLLEYIEEVKEATHTPISILPYADATPADNFQAQFLFGPSFPNIEIRYRPLRVLLDNFVETLIAHELTHALTIYSSGFLMPNGPTTASAYDVQTAANIIDLIDDVIVDVLIYRRNFNVTAKEFQERIRNNLNILLRVKSLSEINTYQPDPVRAEIKLVSDYIHSWALPKYIHMDSSVEAVYNAYTQQFPQALKVPFKKAKAIKKSFLANDIFSVEGRNRVVIDALLLWLANKKIDLSRISPPPPKLPT